MIGKTYNSLTMEQWPHMITTSFVYEILISDRIFGEIHPRFHLNIEVSEIVHLIQEITLSHTKEKMEFMVAK